MRVGATLVHGQGPWSAKLGADWHAAQNRVPDGSVATGAYTLVNASVSYRQKLDNTVLNWFARLDNLTDQLAYSATSILTSTAFGKSPLPGRSFKLGVQASF
jgi:iron complex outermembrane receptor protein